MDNQNAIERSMTIGAVIRKYPQVANVFQSYGLACVGCHVAYEESIEDGARGHGMDEETIDHMIQDANSVAEESAEEVPEGQTVHLTKSAIAKVKEFMNREKKEDAVLRVGVVHGGCAGMSYDLAIENGVQDGDEVVDFDGLKVVISKDHIDSLHGIKIDYVDSLQGSGFKIDNPNAKQGCGCGNSFS